MPAQPVIYTALPQGDTSGVLAGRIGAWLVDFVVIGILWAIFAVALVILGFLTFGLSWMLLAPLWPIVAVIYSGVTVSGPARGTIGQRMFGVELRTTSGQTAPFIVAAVHAVFFYVSISTLTPFVLLFGLVRADRRMLHDLLSGLIAVRRGT
ncbi:hypothetical protein SLNSH_20005 [Alsobacter soli]|uniref:RDD domain-containing protein n=1 Tax=Alsobacter soli TaxID=2109933 RepID=A0A2T1HNI8_9HYPH|nr:RDD family protein [Alsobacter soli]PSC03230.1 hypothetical protein SLNSH_20005 [Alsobacter soli]